jgi:HPt (histidine-containing phosphotransfer) domain-containing protein
MTMQQFDIERALQALDCNLELLKDLASMFVEDSPVLLEQLQWALSNKKTTDVRSIMHSLKGLMSTFYATTGVELAQRLEDSAAIGDLSLYFTGEMDRLADFVRSLEAEFQRLGWTGRL